MGGRWSWWVSPRSSLACVSSASSIAIKPYARTYQGGPGSAVSCCGPTWSLLLLWCLCGLCGAWVWGVGGGVSACQVGGASSLGSRHHGPARSKFRFSLGDGSSSMRRTACGVERRSSCAASIDRLLIQSSRRSMRPLRLAWLAELPPPFLSIDASQPPPPDRPESDDASMRYAPRRARSKYCSGPVLRSPHTHACVARRPGSTPVDSIRSTIDRGLVCVGSFDPSNAPPRPTEQRPLHTVELSRSIAQVVILKSTCTRQPA